MSGGNISLKMSDLTFFMLDLTLFDQTYTLRHRHFLSGLTCQGVVSGVNVKACNLALWPVITVRKDPPEDAGEWEEVKDKRQFIDR